MHISDESLTEGEMATNHNTTISYMIAQLNQENWTVLYTNTIYLNNKTGNPSRYTIDIYQTSFGKTTLDVHDVRM